ncbi:hypothetical protein GGH99_002489, partial [Coemansia sp. RSA 1285]
RGRVVCVGDCRRRMHSGDADAGRDASARSVPGALCAERVSQHSVGNDCVDRIGAEHDAQSVRRGRRRAQPDVQYADSLRSQRADHGRCVYPGIVQHAGVAAGSDAGRDVRRGCFVPVHPGRHGSAALDPPAARPGACRGVHGIGRGRHVGFAADYRVHRPLRQTVVPPHPGSRDVWRGNCAGAAGGGAQTGQAARPAARSVGVPRLAVPAACGRQLLRDGAQHGAVHADADVCCAGAEGGHAARVAGSNDHQRIRHIRPLCRRRAVGPAGADQHACCVGCAGGLQPAGRVAAVRECARRGCVGRPVRCHRRIDRRHDPQCAGHDLRRLADHVHLGPDLHDILGCLACGCAVVQSYARHRWPRPRLHLADRLLRPAARCCGAGLFGAALATVSAHLCQAV